MYLLRACLLLWVCSLVYVILDNGMTECECDFRNEFGVSLGVSLDVTLGVNMIFGVSMIFGVTFGVGVTLSASVSLIRSHPT